MVLTGLFFSPGHAGAIKSGGQSGIQPGSSETRGKKLHWSGNAYMWRWPLIYIQIFSFINVHDNLSGLLDVTQMYFIVVYYYTVFFVNNSSVSCIRFGPRREMHESYQFKNSGKPDNLQLPWTAYHTQVMPFHTPYL